MLSIASGHYLPTRPPEALAWSMVRLLVLFSARSMRYCFRVRVAIPENLSLLRLALHALITDVCVCVWGGGGGEGVSIYHPVQNMDATM